MAQIYPPAPSGRVGLMRIFVAVTALALALAGWAVLRTVWGAFSLHYTLTESALRIEYGPAEVQIPRGEIVAVDQINVTGGRRLFGTGMPGLQEGRWSFAETGRIQMYSTSTQPLTVVETKTGKWGISPSDPQTFADAVTTDATGEWDPVPTNAGTASLLLAAVVLLLLLGTMALMVGVAVGARMITYVLEDERLEVRLGWVKVRVPYGEIRAVELAEPRGYPIKVMGTSMPGFYWGRFGWKGAGAGLKLYSTQLKPIVLVRTGRHTYGLTPEDQEGFVAELKRRTGLN